MRLVTMAFFAAASVAQGAALGINIDMPERGGTYINIVDEAWRWAHLKGGQPLQAGDFGPGGWPRVDAVYILDWRPVAEWAGQVDDPEGYRPDTSGTYKGTFEGTASLRLGGEGRLEGLAQDANGLTSFSLLLPKGAKGFVVLEFSGLKGFKNFKLLRPGYASDAAPFYPPLLAALKGVRFSAIRYMNFTGTNGQDGPQARPLRWEEPRWPAGSRWDRVIALAHASGTDAWINVPLSADAAYVSKLAAYFRAHLDPKLKLYVESSNEVWNTAPGFPQSKVNQADAKRRGLGEHENHARRTLELALAFEKAFGSGSLNTRVRVVLCSHQPMLEWWVEPMLQYVKSTYGQPSKYLWGLACQTYFGARKFRSGEPKEILDACRQDIAAQLDERQGNRAGRRQWAAKAKAWGLPGGFLSYEGGPDHGGGDTRHVAGRITAERSPGMGELMRYNLEEGFARQGGSLAMQFTLTSGYNRYGCWGLSDDIDQPRRNSKYDALSRLADEWSKR